METSPGKSEEAKELEDWPKLPQDVLKFVDDATQEFFPRWLTGMLLKRPAPKAVFSKPVGRVKEPTETSVLCAIQGLMESLEQSACKQFAEFPRTAEIFDVRAICVDQVDDSGDAVIQHWSLKLFRIRLKYLRLKAVVESQYNYATLLGSVSADWFKIADRVRVSSLSSLKVHCERVIHRIGLFDRIMESIRNMQFDEELEDLEIHRQEFVFPDIDDDLHLSELFDTVVEVATTSMSFLDTQKIANSLSQTLEVVDRYLKKESVSPGEMRNIEHFDIVMQNSILGTFEDIKQKLTDWAKKLDGWRRSLANCSEFLDKFMVGVKGAALREINRELFHVYRNRLARLGHLKETLQRRTDIYHGFDITSQTKQIIYSTICKRFLIVDSDYLSKYGRSVWLAWESKPVASLIVYAPTRTTANMKKFARSLQRSGKKSIVFLGELPQWEITEVHECEDRVIQYDELDEVSEIKIQKMHLHYNRKTFFMYDIFYHFQTVFPALTAPMLKELLQKDNDNYENTILWLEEYFNRNSAYFSCDFGKNPTSNVFILMSYVYARNNALHLAVLRGDVDKVRSLLEEGYDVNERDQANRTALHLVHLSPSNRKRIVKVLVEYKINTRLRERLFEYTAVELADRMSENTDSRTILSILPKICMESCMDLFVAAYHNLTTALQFLISAGIDCSLKDSYGNTAGHIAIYAGNDECLKVLLDGGLRADETNDDGESLLFAAVVCQERNCVSMLLEKKANVNNIEHSLCISPVFMAARGGDHKILQMLLEKGGCVNDSSDISRYFTDMYYSLTKEPESLLTTSSEFPTELPESDSSVSQSNFPPFGMMSQNRRQDSCGSSSDSTETSDSTTKMEDVPERTPPLPEREQDLVVQHGSSDDSSISEELPSEIASTEGSYIPEEVVGEPLDTPLSPVAASEVNEEELSPIPPEDNRKESHKFITTPLHVAVWEGNLEAINVLLEMGAMVDIRDSSNNTPLHLAAYKRYHDVTRLLISNRRDIGLKNMYNQTAITIASLKSCTINQQIIEDRLNYSPR